MKASRKVGDAKKHECTFAHRPQNSSSDTPCSKTRVLGLIRSSPSITLCVVSHSQHCFLHPIVLPSAVSKDLFKVSPRIVYKGHEEKSSDEQPSTGSWPVQRCRYGEKKILCVKIGRKKRINRFRRIAFSSSFPLPRCRCCMRTTFAEA